MFIGLNFDAAAKVKVFWETCKHSGAFFSLRARMGTFIN